MLVCSEKEREMKKKKVRFGIQMPGPFLVYCENAGGEKDFSQGDAVAKAGMQGGDTFRSRSRNAESVTKGY